MRTEAETELRQHWHYIINFVHQNPEPLKDALDGMQVFMNGQSSFDVEFYEELVTCLNWLDPRLLASVGAQWDGMIEYAQSRGQENDTWAPCETRGKWFEYNCTTQGSIHILYGQS